MTTGHCWRPLGSQKMCRAQVGLVQCKKTLNFLELATAASAEIEGG